MKNLRAPLVSIIIPVFNVAPYLREALDSVVNQTYRNIEIIIVDDGSTDRSGSICDEYAVKDKRIIVIHQQNQGLSAARNVGLNCMSGEYVSFLDPDDAFHPVFIRKMLDVMNCEDPDIAVCRYSLYKTVGRMRPDVKKTTYPFVKQGMYNRAEALGALADGRINVAVWNKLYKRHLWNDIRFPGGHNYEDLNTTYRIFDKCGRIYVLRDSLYLNRERAGSITRTDSFENILDRDLAFEHLESYMALHAPGTFSEEHLRKYRQFRLNVAIAMLLRLKGKSLFEKQRKKIIYLGNQIGIENCRFRTRVAYLMVCRCPWALSFSYPIYRLFRQLEWRLIGK